MQRSRLKVGLKVYWVKQNYTFDQLSENPDQCLATVVDLDRWDLKMSKWGTHRTDEAYKHPMGRLIHLSVERDGVAQHLYVPAAQIRGTWEVMHPLRTAAIKERRGQVDAKRSRMQDLQTRRREAVDRAAKMGVTAEWGETNGHTEKVYVQLDVEQFERILGMAEGYQAELDR